MLVLPPFYRGARGGYVSADAGAAGEGVGGRLKIRIPAPIASARAGVREYGVGKARGQEGEDEYKDEGEERRESALALDARAYGRTPPRTRAASRGKSLPAIQAQAQGTRLRVFLFRAGCKTLTWFSCWANVRYLAFSYSCSLEVKA